MADLVYKNWTKSAVDCYRIGCNCAKCKLARILESKCMMKKTVMTLVKSIGAPPNAEINETMDIPIRELAKIIGCTQGTVATYLCRTEFGHIVKKREKNRFLICYGVSQKDIDRLKFLCVERDKRKKK